KFESIAVDTIDIKHPVSNQLPEGLDDFVLTEEIPSTTTSFGFSAQEYLSIGKWVNLMGGIRVGTLNSYTPHSTQVVKSNFINPFAGIMVNIWKDINVFGNYTNTTDPSTAEYTDEFGVPLGNETFKQMEAGIRSSWFDKKLRVDLNFYRIDNDG